MLHETMLLLLVAVAGVWAGAQNAVAGGGSFITLGALVLAGLDPKLANIVSTIAMFPGQIVSGFAGRRLIEGPVAPSLAALAAVSLVGGAVGGALLLLTPEAVFHALVPWLVLFATAIFAIGAADKGGKGGARRLPGAGVLPLQFAVAVYGGYYSGGIGFLMLALLGFTGVGVKAASAIKNVLAAVLNSSAVLVFLATTQVPLTFTAALATGAMAGNAWGVWLLKRISDSTLSMIVIVVGLALTFSLFL